MTPQENHIAMLKEVGSYNDEQWAFWIDGNNGVTLSFTHIEALSAMQELETLHQAEIVRLSAERDALQKQVSELKEIIYHIREITENAGAIPSYAYSDNEAACSFHQSLHEINNCTQI